MILYVALIAAAVALGFGITLLAKNKGKSLAEKKDVLLILILSAIYFLTALPGLGNMDSPETSHDIAKESIKLMFTSPVYINDIIFFPTGNEINSLSDVILTGQKKDGTQFEKRIKDYDIFAWKYEKIGEELKSLTVSADCKTLTIGELALTGADGNLLPASGSVKVFDEQELVPREGSKNNSAYFDEKFHARTAYEYIGKISAYEWTHPPMGKIFTSAGIRLFGNTPFGWRFPSLIAGWLLIILIYIFAKRITEKKLIAFLSGLLIQTDFMFFTESRTATPDSFLLLFITLTLYFIYCFGERESEKEGTAYFLLSGLSFGAALSVKWSAAYILPGAVGYFTYILIKEKKSPLKEPLIFPGLAAFIVSAASVYMLSYIPFITPDGQSGIAALVKNQTDILNYHSVTMADAVHKYSSPWYMWFLNKKYILFHGALLRDGKTEVILAAGNPVIWLSSLPATVTAGIMILKKKEKLIFPLIFIISQVLPWAITQRTSFMYHFLPCIPMIILIWGAAVNELHKKLEKTAKAVCITFTAAAVISFIIFFPLISGIPLNTETAGRLLSLL